MDAVILAAGENKRIANLVGAYRKPLVKIDNSPLLIQHMENLSSLCDTVITVVSPYNATEIILEVDESYAGHLAEDKLRFVLQPFPTGPAQALRLGLEMAHSPVVMVVCADNVIPKEELWKVFQSQESFAIGTQLVSDSEEADRLTCISPAGRVLFKREKPSPWSDSYYRCWLGPLLVPRSLADVIKASGDNEIQDVMARWHDPIELVMNDTVIDIGTPRSLAEAIGYSGGAR